MFAPPFAGVTLNALFVHASTVSSAIAGVGSTVTFTSNDAPAQPNALSGVTVYVTVIAAFVVLTSVPVIAVSFVPAAKPVIPAAVGALQE